MAEQTAKKQMSKDDKKPMPSKQNWGRKKPFRQVKIRSIFHFGFIIFCVFQHGSHDYRCHFNHTMKLKRDGTNGQLNLSKIDRILSERNLFVCLHVVWFCHFVQFYWKHNTFNRILAKDKLLMWCMLDCEERRIRLISQLCLIKCRLIESLPTSSSVSFELR